MTLISRTVRMGLLVAAIACASTIFSSMPAQGQESNSSAAPTAQATPARRPPLTPEQRAAFQQGAEDRLKNDWADLSRFRDANAALPTPAPGENRVVFMGDSITQIWTPANGFPHPPGATAENNPYINRGISGQTTPQMLVRFRQDVVNLKPKVVVILAGTNDIAGNTGPEMASEIEDMLMSMSDIAHANHIRVVLCSITPVYDYPWKTGLVPAPEIAAINQWMKSYAAQNGYVYVDYYSAMVDARGGLPANLSKDGVHPTKDGFAIMAPIVEAGIEKALE